MPSLLSDEARTLIEEVLALVPPSFPLPPRREGPPPDAHEADPYSELYAPYPEIVLHDPRPYTIYDSTELRGLSTQGMTNKVDRGLVVPLREDGGAIRLHELGHVRYSPPRLPMKARFPGLLLGVEDARVNMALAARGKPLEFSADLRSKVDAIVRAELAACQIRNVVMRQIAALGTNAETDVLRIVAAHAPAHLALASLLNHTVKTRLEASARRCRGGVASFPQARRLADWLGEQLGGDCQLGRGHGTCIVCLDAGGSPRRRDRGARGRALPDLDRALELHHVPPGRMTVVTAPLTRPYTHGRGNRRYRFRPSTEGMLVRYPLRRYLGGAIFQRSSRRHGATVLIDVSGSMRLQAGDIDTILAATLSTATVAIYSGSEDRGELRIVAKNGRRAEGADLEPFGGGNIVDKPALEWLARQPGARLWVSDGGVTGSGDNPARTITRACERIRLRAGILRVDSATAAAVLLMKQTR